MPELLPPSNPPQDQNTQKADNEQTSIPEWLKGIDDPALQESKFLHRFADVKTLAQNALAAKQTLSKKLVDIPNAESTPEQWNEFHTALGRPSKPEEYQITFKGEDGKPLKIKDQSIDALIRNAAYKVGANNDGFNTIIEAIMEREASLPNMARESLEKEWKGDFEKNRQIADKAFQSLPESLQTEIAETVGPHPAIMKMLLEIGKHTMNDSLPDSLTKPKTEMESEGELQKRFDELRNDSAFKNRNDPRFKDVNDELVAIREKIIKIRGGNK